MLRGTSLMNLRFVSQRSRSQFLMFSNLILFNQNIVWGFLTKFGTKIDSYKMDVYGTSGISNLAVIFKMATKMLKNWPCPFQRKLLYRANMMWQVHLLPQK
jgi:hypothetical protein